MSASARATATTMLDFLGKLKADHTSGPAVSMTAKIIVDQFKRDLEEMNVVCDPYVFEGTLGRVL